MASSPAGESSALVFSDLGGLSDDWDSVRLLRERMRVVGRLVVDKPEEGKAEVAGEVTLKTMQNVKYNATALLPLVKKMRGEYDKFVELNALARQIKDFFQKNGLVPTAKVLSDQAWSIRYLLYTLKSVLYRKGPPSVTWMQ